jgi:hypothetical protein
MVAGVRADMPQNALPGRSSSFRERGTLRLALPSDVTFNFPGEAIRSGSRGRMKDSPGLYE